MATIRPAYGSGGGSCTRIHLIESQVSFLLDDTAMETRVRVALTSSQLEAVRTCLLCYRVVGTPNGICTRNLHLERVTAC